VKTAATQQRDMLLVPPTMYVAWIVFCAVTTREISFIYLTAIENGSEDIHLLSNGVAFISSVSIDKSDYQYRLCSNPIGSICRFSV